MTDDDVTLAIDTSGGTEVAVLRGEDVLARAARPDARGHAENLAPLVSDVLARAGLEAGEVSRIAVGTGPAPFTGLRVGLVTAAAFAAARAIPVHGVPSLEAWVPALPEGGSVRVVTDARRREVYTAVYVADESEPGGLRVVEEPQVVAPAQLEETVAAEREAGIVVVGPGLYPELLGPSESGFDVAALARIARARAEAGRATPTEPLYLRRPDVHGVPGGAA